MVLDIIIFLFFFKLLLLTKLYRLKLGGSVLITHCVVFLLAHLVFLGSKMTKKDIDFDSFIPLESWKEMMQSLF